MRALRAAGLDNNCARGIAAANGLLLDDVEEEEVVAAGAAEVVDVPLVDAEKLLLVLISV